MFEFKNMTEKDLPLVLLWRTEEDITKCLFTDLDQPSLENQRAWFKKITADPSCNYWMVYMNKSPIGVIFITEIDHTHHRASYGTYIGVSDKRKFGGFVMPTFYNYVFSQEGLGLHKLCWEVLSWLTNVIDLHKFHGAKIVGTARDHVFKNNIWQDVVIMELLSSDWHKDTRWHKMIGSFEPCPKW